MRGQAKLVEHLKTRITRMGKLKLVVIFPRITCITRIGQAEAWFYYLAESAESAENAENAEIGES